MGEGKGHRTGEGGGGGRVTLAVLVLYGYGDGLVTASLLPVGSAEVVDRNTGSGSRKSRKSRKSPLSRRAILPVISSGCRVGVKVKGGGWGTIFGDGDT
jgi:hypothetical protein